MSAPAFTPGPWTFNDPWAGFSSITDADGKLIFGIARGDPDETQPVPVCEANARLIAAAPELYEALNALLTYVAGFDREGLPVFEQSAAALAKARGEQ
jgi:hypothetical protein